MTNTLELKAGDSITLNEKARDWALGIDHYICRPAVLMLVGPLFLETNLGYASQYVGISQHHATEVSKASISDTKPLGVCPIPVEDNK